MVRTSRVVVTTAVTALAVLGGAIVAAAPAVADPITVSCESFSVNVPRDGVYRGKVTCETSDGSPVDSYERTSDPALGDAYLDPDTGDFTFTPNEGVVETDTFSFAATSAGVTSDDAYAMLDISNFAPTCSTPSTVTTRHDRALEITPACEDANGDDVTLQATVAPGHGTVTPFTTDDGVAALRYKPTAGFVGTDTLTFLATDGELSGSPVTQKVTVTNAAPTCTVPAVAVAHGRPRVVTVSCRDADGDVLSVAASGARNGTVTRVAPTSFRFTPTRRFVGTASFTVTASDKLASVARSVPVRVTNAAPRLSAPTSISVRGRKVFRVTATDADRDLVAVVVSAKPRHGTVTVRGRTVTYVPSKRFTGRDAFALRATDGVAWSAVSRLRATVRR